MIYAVYSVLGIVGAYVYIVIAVGMNSYLANRWANECAKTEGKHHPSADPEWHDMSYPMAMFWPISTVLCLSYMFIRWSTGPVRKLGKRIAVGLEQKEDPVTQEALQEMQRFLDRQDS